MSLEDSERNCLLQQDGAASHSSNMTTGLLVDLLGTDLLIKDLPRSSDPTPRLLSKKPTYY